MEGMGLGASVACMGDEKKVGGKIQSFGNRGYGKIKPFWTGWEISTLYFSSSLLLFREDVCFHKTLIKYAGTAISCFQTRS